MACQRDSHRDDTSVLRRTKMLEVACWWSRPSRARVSRVSYSANEWAAITCPSRVVVHLYFPSRSPRHQLLTRNGDATSCAEHSLRRPNRRVDPIGVRVVVQLHRRSYLLDDLEGDRW